MDVFSHPIIAVIILLGLLVFVHEAGHFIVGKLCGIAVEIFSLGFGPVIFSYQHKETNYRLSIIPLGGFVKFYGSTRKEDVPAELKGREFYRASVWKRVITVLAGPFANFLLAITAYTGMVMIGIPQPPPVVGELMAGSPADRAGFQFEDRITAINDEPTHTWRDLQSIIVRSPGETLRFQVKRGDQLLDLTVTPDNIHDKEMIGRKNRGQIGISPGHVPSVVTVTDPNAIAATAGLRTGDKILEMTAGGEKKAIRYWREWLNELSGAKAKGLNEVTLQVQTFKNPDQKINPAEQRTVVLPIEKLDQSTPQNYPKLLGLNHSQLTLAEEHLKNVPNLQFGDQILGLGDMPVTDVFDFRNAVLAQQKAELPVSVLRDGQVLQLTVAMKPVDVQKAEGKVKMYTFPAMFLGQIEQPDPVIEQYSNPFKAAWYGIKETGEQVVMISVAVAGLFTGDMPLEALGGPISIAKVASDSVKMGWMSFFSALGLISVNLGLLNLFPIPVLDGGQLVLLGAEAVRRRPLGDLAIENFQKVGFVMVLALVAMATYNDLSRFWASMIEGVSGFFQ